MQAENSITNPHFNQLKEISGRLSRLLLRKDKVLQEEPARPRMLVVEDEESIRFSLSEYFSHGGFIVDTAEELKEAEKLIGSNNYQVVIQDLRLDFTCRNHGLEIIKLIRRRSLKTRIVVLTSYGSTEIEAEARGSGADAFLYKPIPLSQLAQVVQGLIESRQRTAPDN